MTETDPGEHRGDTYKDDIEEIICSNLSELFGKSIFEKEWKRLKLSGKVLSRSDAIDLIEDLKDLLIAIFGKRIAKHITAELLKYLDPMIIHEVYLIDNSGCLIAHTPDMKSSKMDVDLISGMFTAIQDFVRVTFSQHQRLPLKKMKIGDKKIYITHGHDIYLVIVYSGHLVQEDYEMLANFVNELERSYRFDTWETNVPALFEIGDKIKTLFSVEN